MGLAGMGEIFAGLMGDVSLLAEAAVFVFKPVGEEAAVSRTLNCTVPRGQRRVEQGVAGQRRVERAEIHISAVEADHAADPDNGIADPSTIDYVTLGDGTVLLADSWAAVGGKV